MGEGILKRTHDSINVPCNRGNRLCIGRIATEQSGGWYTTSMRHQVKRIDIGQSGG